MANTYCVRVVDGIVIEASCFSVSGDVPPPVPEGFIEIDAATWKVAQAGATTSGDGAFTPVATPIVVSRSDFARLFRVAQEKNIRRAMRRGLAADATDQQRDLAENLEVFFGRLDLAGDEISLSHPDVIDGLALLVAAEQVTGVTAAERDRILANIPPE